ncbi:hypothetical protein BDY19DRAFT_968158 [Irpex rosettiformis]|uniref:Uncharacterized protein n=1 Tax=Irpex rosettiformis TaxID=378272 RepID=A0ACB8TSJ2_9APHY|nr:hypothetical protein BDY19DRAFT_968158 [Irpex rosettiformis]
MTSTMTATRAGSCHGCSPRSHFAPIGGLWRFAYGKPNSFYSHSRSLSAAGTRSQHDKPWKGNMTWPYPSIREVDQRRNHRREVPGDTVSGAQYARLPSVGPSYHRSMGGTPDKHHLLRDQPDFSHHHDSNYSVSQQHTGYAPQHLPQARELLQGTSLLDPTPAYEDRFSFVAQERCGGQSRSSEPDSQRQGQDAQRQGFTIQNPSIPAETINHLDTSPLQDIQGQFDEAREVQDLPLPQVNTGHEDDTMPEERVKRSRRTNAKRPMPISGEIHDSSYMGFASDDDFCFNSNHIVKDPDCAHILPQLVLMYPKPGWEPKPSIDFKVGGKLGVNLQEAHKAYLRDCAHVALEPLDECIRVTDSKARCRLPVMIYLRWPEYDDFRMSVSMSNHRVKIQSAESVRYLAGRIAFVVSNFLQAGLNCIFTFLKHSSSGI